jgi:hypothetical protein
VTGAEVLAEMERLMTTELARESEGLTNRELAQRTGLWVDIERQRGYITWTILQQLLEQGRVRKARQRYMMAGA